MAVVKKHFRSIRASLLALYFGAKSSRACRNFSPKLDKFAKKYKDNIAIFFCTDDKSKKDYKQYFGKV